MWGTLTFWARKDKYSEAWVMFPHHYPNINWHLINNTIIFNSTSTAWSHEWSSDPKISFIKRACPMPLRLSSQVDHIIIWVLSKNLKLSTCPLPPLFIVLDLFIIQFSWFLSLFSKRDASGARFKCQAHVSSIVSPFPHDFYKVFI